MTQLVNQKCRNVISKLDLKLAPNLTDFSETIRNQTVKKIYSTCAKIHQKSAPKWLKTTENVEISLKNWLKFDLKMAKAGWKIDWKPKIDQEIGLIHLETEKYWKCCSKMISKTSSNFNQIEFPINWYRNGLGCWLHQTTKNWSRNWPKTWLKMGNNWTQNYNEASPK